MNFKLQGTDRDASVGIDRSIYSETEDVLRRFERRPDLEFSKERLFLVQGSLKTKIRDLLGGGVDLSVIISVDFLSKDLLGGFDSGDVFSDAGSDKAVLEPTVGALNFAFGLRREGISDFHITILQDLFPLWGCLIG